MPLSHVGMKERYTCMHGDVHACVHGDAAFVYVHIHYICIYRNPREKPEPPPISLRSARALARVNKLSRFIPFFHRAVFSPSA